MNVVLHPEADAELAAAVEWYEECDLVPYAVRADDIVVLAVAHAKRRPGYWRRRIQ